LISEPEIKITVLSFTKKPQNTYILVSKFILNFLKTTFKTNLYVLLNKHRITGKYYGFKWKWRITSKVRWPYRKLEIIEEWILNTHLLLCFLLMHERRLILVENTHFQLGYLDSFFNFSTLFVGFFSFLKISDWSNVEVGKIFVSILYFIIVLATDW
jgi:hypothetical protein